MTDSQQRRTSTLLALRDGELAPAERSSLLADETARKELEALERLGAELRSLPNPEPDPEMLAAIQARLAPQSAPASPSPVSRPARLPRALAAGLLLAVTAGLVTLGVEQRGGGLPARDLSGMTYALPEDPVLAALHARSRHLEALALRSGSLADDPVASSLKLRIADLDGQLDAEISPEETQRLWGQRVAILESMAEVRRARAALQPAVF
ncbi:MAG: hypothetical protein AAGE43_08205 [Pseudomonadota bacterium]